MNTELVALCGLAGSGKSTIAGMLIDDFDFHRVKFAAPLKKMLRALGLSNAHLEGKLKEIPCDILGMKTPREAMQSLGTEWGRNIIHPDLWINAWKHTVQDYLDRGFKVVVDDCRFPNERKAVQELGGITIMIERPGIAPVNSHISEQYLMMCDATIVNDGSLSDLRSNIAALLK